MSIAAIEASFTARAAEFSALGATVKVDFGDDVLFIDATKTPAVISHADEEADTTLIVSADTLEKILAEELDATMAFMTGKLKVKGSTSIAMKLAGILK